MLDSSGDGAYSTGWLAIRVEDSDMIRLNAFQLYKLGASLEQLRGIQADQSPDSYFGQMMHARRELKALTESEQFSLGTSRPAAQALSDAIWDVNKKVWDHFRATSLVEGGEAPVMEPVTWTEANNIARALRDFEPVLAAELQEKPTYHILKKGIFYTPDLIERADCIFSATLPIPEAARVEIKAAGRCLAFELWTATGFHIFRGTETLILEYYDALTEGKKPLKEGDRNWGNYIKLLSEEGADSKIVAYLQYLKDNHRNPVMHPEITLDADEAIALFLAAPNAIVPLAKVIAAKGTAVVVPPPPTVTP
jgi:hypothetical protein